MTLIPLGTGAGGPFHGRHYTSHILQLDNQVFMIDCGEGTQMQLFHHRIRFDHCQQIFITHLHGDHVFGLMGLITNWCLKKRTAPLHLYAPPGLQDLVESTCRICQVRVPYPLEFHVVDASVSQKVFENGQVEVWTIPLDHRTPTAGWLFREKLRPRNIRADQIEQYAIPYALIPGIKAGDDLILPDGQIVPNQELTTPPPAPRSFAFCSDTAPSDAVVAAVQGVNLLYHEATFTETHLAEATLSCHSTAAQAASIARRAGVGRLLLGHFSGRYTDAEQHLAEARAIFPNTEAAEEGRKVEI